MSSSFFMKAALTQIVDIAEKNGIMVIDKAAAEKIAELRNFNFVVNH